MGKAKLIDFGVYPKTGIKPTDWICSDCMNNYIELPEADDGDLIYIANSGA